MFHKTFIVKVTTGQAKGAGTDANVKITLIDENKNSHEEKLNKWFHNDFEYGAADEYTVKAPKDFGCVKSIKLHRDAHSHGLKDKSDWFVEHVSVEHSSDGIVHFPLVRWIVANKQMQFVEYDSCLPQQCEEYGPELVQQRQDELKDKQESFAFGHIEDIPGMPRNVLLLPPEENFARGYQGQLGASLISGVIESFIKNFRYDDPKFDSFEDILKLYFGVNNPFDLPTGVWDWRTDEKFAWLRVAGPNPTTIRGCKKNGGLPTNFAVEKDVVAKQFFEGQTFDQALQADRLFYIDYQCFEEYTVKGTEMPMVCPFALFYSRMDGVLIPIAIQLYQKPSSTNPVFYPPPIDEERVWLLAKLWFGVADSNYHEPVTHLLQTHLVAGDFITCFHNTISPSHPVYKLMLPHFIFLLNINFDGLPILIGDKGAFNEILILGKENCDGIMVKKYSEWNLQEMGWLDTEVANRGVENLQNYFYYEDSKPIFDAIYEYIKSSVNFIYGNDDKKLDNDPELTAFAALLCKEDGGMKGVWGDGHFSTLEQLSKTLTSLVFILSNVHAAVNFNQYDEYGYPPNFPLRLDSTQPPTNKNSVTEDELVKLFDKKLTLNTLLLISTLSLQGTNKIGNYEITYQYKPSCVASYEKFRVTLDAITKENDAKNKKRRTPYPWLSPNIIPNSISI